MPTIHLHPGIWDMNHDVARQQTNESMAMAGIANET